VILSIADFLWFIGAELPPVGAVLSVVFLFALAESMRRERLIDLYEMIGRLVVSTALAFCLAGIFYVFVTWVGFETMYLNAVLAAIAILLLFEPLRDKVEERIHAIFFRQRHDLELAVQEVQEKLVHVLEIDEMGEALIGALGRSRRFTAVALYLLEREGSSFALRNSTSDTAPPRIEVATLRPILDCLRKQSSLVLENLGTAEQKTRDEGCQDVEAIAAAAQVLGDLHSSVMLPIRVPPGEVVGFLVVQDDRVRDAFTGDEVAVLERIVPLASVVVENTRAYARMKERDRLAALGQMAAGLAHEIKNPLGSIKGAAQFLLDSEEPLPAASRDFLDIILEEVDRLDRVVDRRWTMRARERAIRPRSTSTRWFV
jgi:Signal transduction histidine kinase, nitrogen specific